MAKIVNFGVCLNNDDPLMAGRIRATFDTDFKSMSPGDYSDSILNTILSDTIEKAGQQGGDPKYTSTENIMWSEDDPFVCAPFLPSFINIIPTKNENVKLILYNNENSTQNIEYVGPTISQPTKFPYDYYANARLHTSRGTNVKASPQLRNSTVSKGCFAFENTIALNGRLNSDLIFGDRQLILRAGKFHESEISLEKNGVPPFPKTNYQQSILQLDNFKDKLSLDVEKKIVPKSQDASLSHLIEYEISNWAGGAGVAISPTFDGAIRLYAVTPLDGEEVIFAGKVNIGTEFTPKELNTKVTLYFKNQPEKEVIRLINEFIREADIGKLTNPPHESTSLTGEWWKKEFDEDYNFASSTSGEDTLMRIYPFYFRPNFEFQTELNGQFTSISARNNAANITNKILLNGVSTSWFGLAFDDKERSVPVKNEEVDKDVESWTVGSTQGITSIFSNEILLFSYDASIPDKESATPIVDSFDKTSPELGDNIGVDQKTLVKLGRDNMEPLVRGNELINLLKEIWDFISNHEHGWPGTEPKDTTKSTRTEGPATKESIKTRLENAEKTLLNKHIKIN